MTKPASKREFLLSEKAETLREELQKMVDDVRYNTRLRYSAMSPDGTDFITKHMAYMSDHPQMDHGQYVLNLKLMTKLNVPTR